MAIPDRQVECGHAIRTRRIQTLLTRRILSLVGEQADDVRMTSVGRQVELGPAIWKLRIRVRPGAEQGVDGLRVAIAGRQEECGLTLNRIFQPCHLIGQAFEQEGDDVASAIHGRQVEWRPAIRSPRIRVPPELEQGFDGSRFAILGCHVECGHAI